MGKHDMCVTLSCVNEVQTNEFRHKGFFAFYAWDAKMIFTYIEGYYASISHENVIYMKHISMFVCSVECKYF